MQLLCIGVSHHTAPLEVRERLAVAPERQRELLAGIAQADGEALLLSTCNRVEFYVAAEAPAAIRDQVRAVIREVAGAAAEGHAYELEGDRALIHLFRVAASLDSMVVGEPQILGQVKDALALAQEVGTVRGELTRACAAAFASAKRVRTETAIGRTAVSMASAAIELARKVFGELTGKTALVIGAGEMAELAARHLKGAGASRLWVANRTLQNAEAVAAQVGGAARGLDELGALLVEADVVVTSTASPTPLLHRGNVAPSLRARKHRPLFVVDLAVPRDVAPDVAQLPGVYAYDVDDLQRVVEDNTAARAAEAARAEVIVAEEAAQFVRLRAQREATPVLAQLRQRAEEIARLEVQRTLQALGPGITDKQRRSVEAMASAIVNKLLHQPTVRLRAVGGDEGRLADAAAELFGLDEAAAVGGKR